MHIRLKFGWEIEFELNIGLQSAHSSEIQHKKTHSNGMRNATRKNLIEIWIRKTHSS